MIRFLLDIRDDSFEEVAKEKPGTNWLLIGAAVVAVLGIIALFVWNKRKKQQAKK